MAHISPSPVHIHPEPTTGEEFSLTLNQDNYLRETPKVRASARRLIHSLNAANTCACFSAETPRMMGF